eukprot:3066667-Karenia_brevis.AAC.1
MELHRRQPTYKNIRNAARELSEAHEGGPTLEQMCAKFPGVDRELLHRLWELDTETDACQHFTTQWLEHFGETQECSFKQEMSMKSSRSTVNVSDRTEQACRLKAENLQFALDELTRAVPTREREKGRAMEAFGKQ